MFIHVLDESCLRRHSYSACEKQQKKSTTKLGYTLCVECNTEYASKNMSLHKRTIKHLKNAEKDNISFFSLFLLKLFIIIKIIEEITLQQELSYATPKNSKLFFFPLGAGGA